MNPEIETPSAWCVGLLAIKNGVEIHAVNDRSQVVLQGWFPLEAAIALVGSRPSTLIAVDAETLPEKIAADLAILGHSVVVVPPSRDRWNRPTRRRAKDIYSLGVSLLNRMN